MLDTRFWRLETRCWMLDAPCSILAADEVDQNVSRIYSDGLPADGGIRGLMDWWTSTGQGVGCRVSGGPHVDRSSWPPAIAPEAVGMADSSLRQNRAAEKKLFSP